MEHYTELRTNGSYIQAGLLLLLLLSHFSRVRLCVTPWTTAYQVPLSLGFSRQEHWSGLPFPSPMQESEKWKWSRSVMSDSQRPHGLQPTRLLRPWDFPGKSTGVGYHCPLWQAGLELTNITLNKRSHVEKRLYCMVPHCIIQKKAKSIEVRIIITLEFGSD